MKFSSSDAPLLNTALRGPGGIREEVIMELDRKTQDAFEIMIDDSIARRYDSGLERLGEGHHGEICYRPLDPDHVSSLLVDLWGEILTPETINEAFDRLMEEQGEWPRGYCEEDEEERPLSSYGPD